MTRRERIEQMTAQLMERHEARQARLVALEDIKRAHLRNVALSLPEVPPELERYLAEPNVFLRQERSVGPAATNGRSH